MKISNFWLLTLCALPVIASVNGWSLPLRIATAANALVVLVDVSRGTVKILRGSEKPRR